MAIKIVTDSTADIPEGIASEYGIEIVPLNVHFGEEVYKDGVDIWSEEFYNRLRNEPVLPNTSQPSPGDFLKAYQKIAKPGDTIISIHISREMSGTADSAQLAAEMMGTDYQILIVDSRQVTLSLGVVVIAAAKAVKEGASVETIIANLNKWKSEVKIFFTLKSLEHLHRNGRIGKASVLMGGLLNIKPILSIEEGLIVPIEKARGNFHKVAEILVDKVIERYGNQRLYVGIIHTELQDDMNVLVSLAKQKLNIEEMVINLAGAIVGSHVGQNAIGIIILPV
ncbi:MAG: DegV family protein [Firmicutes bacterium]|nr:DegV family protein [Bacillota bacterium]